MPRFVKQRDKFSCGPLAILNALKWQGRRFSVGRNMPLIRKACHCVYPTGTPPRCFRKVAATLGFQRLWRPTIKRIDRALADGNAVIVRGLWIEEGEKQGHLFLLTKRSERNFYGINVFGTGWRSKAFIKWCYLNDVHIGPAAWIVKPQPSEARLQAA